MSSEVLHVCVHVCVSDFLSVWVCLQLKVTVWKSGKYQQPLRPWNDWGSAKHERPRRSIFKSTGRTGFVSIGAVCYSFSECVCVCVSTFTLLWGGSVCVTYSNVVVRSETSRKLWDVQRPAEKMFAFSSFFQPWMFLKQRYDVRLLTIRDRKRQIHCGYNWVQ